MDEKILKWLYDIKSAIDEIEGYFNDFPKDFNQYSTNLILKRDPNFPIDNARKIVGLRNQIIHAYDNISDENIWAIIQKYLPLLKQEVIKLIQE